MLECYLELRKAVFGKELKKNIYLGFEGGISLSFILTASIIVNSTRFNYDDKKLKNMIELIDKFTMNNYVGPLG